MNERIFPLGDNALTIEFGSEISAELNNRVLKLAQFFDEKPFAGFLESVPTYASLTIFYDLVKVRKSYPEFTNAYGAVKSFAENALGNLREISKTDSRIIEIPVCFDEEFAPDLAFVAAHNNLSTEKVIEIFLGKTYRVFMLGFLPGFSYMGKLNARIAVPRKLSPRLQVPAGSVGIAGRQTGIYSLESPGGWQIIGRTPLKTFTPEAENSVLLRVGDSIKFDEISKKVFDNLFATQ